MPKDYGAVGESGKSPQVGLLSGRLVWVIRQWLNSSREILDLYNFMFGEQETAEFGRVKPFVRSTLDGSVVKVESVNVDVGRSFLLGHKKQKPSEDGFAPCAEATGVVSTSIIVAAAHSVNKKMSCCESVNG